MVERLQAQLLRQQAMALLLFSQADGIAHDPVEERVRILIQLIFLQLRT